MKKTALALLVVAALSASWAGAGEAPGKPKLTKLQTWFKHFKEGLAQSSVSESYQKRRVTAVAAVRGAAQGSVDPDKPAWKGTGKSKRDQQIKKERAELTQAVDLILAGKLKDGADKLDAFETAHPKSPLLSDVKAAREKVKEMEAAAPPQEPSEPEEPAQQP